MDVSQDIYIIKSGTWGCSEGNFSYVLILCTDRDLKRDADAKKHFTIESHHSVIVTTVCDNARSQGVKFDDVFFMCTEIVRTDSAWTRGLNFRVTM